MPKQSDPCEFFVDEEDDSIVLGVEWADGTEVTMEIERECSDGSTLASALNVLQRYIRSLEN